jgi:hypothetical protein
MNKKTDSLRRKQLAREFIRSEFYVNYLRPHLEKKMVDADSLSNINQNDLENLTKNFFKQLNKKEIYRGLIRILEEWSTKIYKDEEVKRHGTTRSKTR